MQIDYLSNLLQIFQWANIHIELQKQMKNYYNQSLAILVLLQMHRKT